MGTFVQTDVRLWVAEYDLSADMNAVALVISQEIPDATQYGILTRTVKPGLKGTELTAEGYWQDPVDAAIDSQLGLSGVPYSLGPVDGSEGSPGYCGELTVGAYTPLTGAVGDMLGFSFTGMAAGQYATSGLILANRSGATSSSNASGYQLGAVAAGQSLYAALHVIASSGGTLTVSLESDDNAGFTTPVSQGSFAGVSAPGSEFLTIAGAITDDYWRVAWTISAGTHTFVVVAGIA